MAKHHWESTTLFGFWKIWLHVEFGPLTCSRGLPWTRWTTPCGEGENGLRHVRSPGLRARTRFGWLAHFFLTFFRNGSLGNLSYTLYDDLVNRLWWVSWPPLSPGPCRATIKSEVKLEKTLTFVLIATKTSWLFPQLKTETKLNNLSRTM